MEVFCVKVIVASALCFLACKYLWLLGPWAWLLFASLCIIIEIRTSSWVIQRFLLIIIWDLTTHLHDFGHISSFVLSSLSCFVWNSMVFNSRQIMHNSSWYYNYLGFHQSAVEEVEFSYWNSKVISLFWKFGMLDVSTSLALEKLQYRTSLFWWSFIPMHQFY